MISSWKKLFIFGIGELVVMLIKIIDRDRTS